MKNNKYLNVLYILMSPKIGKISNAQYKMAENHIDFYIGKVVDSPDCAFTLEELREWLAEEIGFHFQIRTLKNYLRERQERLGESPLEQVYRLNPAYFKIQKVKVPNPHEKRN